MPAGLASAWSARASAFSSKAPRAGTPGSSRGAPQTTASSTFAAPGSSWGSSSRWSSLRRWLIRCAARSALRRRPLKTRPLEFVLSPVDNQRLANLCGTLDENLRQIETALDVTIARRGERFTVRGAQAAQAADVLQKFYEDATRGLTLDDIQLGLIEVRSRGRRSKRANALGSSREILLRRSIPTCDRSTTRSTTCWVSTRPASSLSAA